MAHDAGSTVELRRYRQQPHFARRGRHGLRHLPLHHDHHPVDRRHGVEQVADQRHRDVVRQVGYKSPRTVTQQVIPVDRHGVAVDDPYPLGRVLPRHLGQHAHQHVIDLDCDHVGIRL